MIMAMESVNISNALTAPMPSVSNVPLIRDVSASAVEEPQFQEAFINQSQVSIIKYILINILLIALIK